MFSVLLALLFFFWYHFNISALDPAQEGIQGNSLRGLIRRLDLERRRSEAEFLNPPK